MEMENGCPLPEQWVDHEVYKQTYYGENIYRHAINGMWITRVPGHGLLRADTLDGIKFMIRRTRSGHQ